MARPRTNPLLAALIAELPAKGEAFPSDRQRAWLELMAMALAATYGGEVVRLGAGAVASPAAEEPKSPASKFKAAPAKAGPAHPFVIDEQGYAKNKAGKRILPAEVTSEIHDLRGMDGDMKTIIWADGSTGLNGRDLTITAA